MKAMMAGFAAMIFISIAANLALTEFAYPTQGPQSSASTRATE